MVQYLKLIACILNFIAGYIAGMILVILTDNYYYYLINFITGFTSGILFYNAVQESD